MRRAVLVLSVALAPAAFAHGENLIYCFSIIAAGAWIIPGWFVVRNRHLSRLSKSITIAAMLLTAPLVWHLLWHYSAPIFTLLLPSVTAAIVAYSAHLWEQARTE